MFANPSNIIISDDDIATLERRSTLTFDEERRNVLRCMCSVDVRACPGSGKTTLLVAKLALLASRWTWKHRGLCVLSHTNVAKDEIKKGFGLFPELQLIASYPHFIGTIQSFIDQFLGIPGAMLAFGRRPHTIDNDRFQSEITRELFGPAYETMRNALRPLTNSPSTKTFADYVGSIKYSDSNLSIAEFPTKSRPWGPETTSGRQARRLKEQVSRSGFFLYSDMDVLGSYLLKQRPGVIDAICRRFPIVFIDEMQDTPTRQSRLLHEVFNGQAVVQRIGDDRQTIFQERANEDETSDFPSANTISISRSFRLSPKVSSLVQNLCCETPEPLVGNPKRKDGRHTVFLFSKDSIGAVLARFAELVSKDVGVGLPAKDIRAVGLVAKDKEDAKGFPSSLCDYWPEYPQHDRKPQRFLNFGGYLNEAASHLRAPKSAQVAVRAIIDGICRALRMHSPNHNGVEFICSSFLTTLNELSPTIHREFRKAITELCVKLHCPSGSIAEADLKPLIKVLEALLEKKLSGEAQRFLTQKTDTTPADASKIPLPIGHDPVFRYSTADGIVEIGIGTIHSVKGETVRAIIVLDTFFHKQHLATLLTEGLLLGKRPAKAPQKRLSHYIRHAFVATTRPTDLLCLAMQADHVDESSRRALETLGWNICEC